MEKIIIILAALLALSEALALIPAVKANSVYQLIVGVLAKAKELLSPKTPA